jgi:Winged helix-turn helix
VYEKALYERLQETRKMRFRKLRRLTQEEAARFLNVCERTFRRHVGRYEDESLEGLLGKRINQVSQRLMPGMKWRCWPTVTANAMKAGMPSTFTRAAKRTAAGAATPAVIKKKALCDFSG